MFKTATTRVQIRSQIVKSSKIYSHIYIRDAEPAPYGSSFTEEQEEERENEEETGNVQVRKSSQAGFSRQAIRTGN